MLKEGRLIRIPITHFFRILWLKHQPILSIHSAKAKSLRKTGTDLETLLRQMDQKPVISSQFVMELMREAALKLVRWSNMHTEDQFKKN